MTPIIPAKAPSSGGRFRRWLAKWFGCLLCFDGKEHGWIDCLHIMPAVRCALAKAEREIAERKALAAEIASAVAAELRK